MGRHHQAEFTMLEWYRTGWSYQELMDECEEFVRTLVRTNPELKGIQGTDTLLRQGRMISLAPPWERLTVAEAFHKYSDMTVQQALDKDVFDEVLVTQIEPHLGWDTPVFLYDYPVELGSLAKQKKNEPGIAERFELYIGGVELANGFSELTDPEEQRERFVIEMSKVNEQGNTYTELPEKFLADLENLGDTAGIALGLDRLFMILLSCDTVAEVMCMPFEEL